MQQSRESQERRLARLRSASERRKSLLLDFLRKHPETPGTKIKGRLATALHREYGNNIKNARRDAGISEETVRMLRRRPQAKLVRQEVVDWIRNNPHKRIYELWRTLPSGTKLNDLRREAGLIPPNYVSAAEKARLTGVSRQWIRHLIQRRRLKHICIGKNVFIHRDAMPLRPKGKPGRLGKT